MLNFQGLNSSIEVKRAKSSVNKVAQQCASKDVAFEGTESKRNLSSANCKAYFANTVNLSDTLKSLNTQSKIGFGHRIEVHNSWGVNINDNGETKVKTWAPKAKEVYMEIRPADKPIDGGEWSHDNGKITVDKIDGQTIIKSADEHSTVIKLESQDNGIFTASTKDIKSGDKYRFLLVKHDDSIAGRKDYYAKKQDGVGSWSTAYDHSDFEWGDKRWMSDGNNKRIGPKNPNVLPTIKEIHIGIMSPEGDFEHAKSKIDKIAQNGAFNTIELMPVEGFYGGENPEEGFGWGYDGVDKLAPTEIYGGPEKLKELIDYAHNKGLNVLMDVVPNHMGPNGNYLDDFGPFQGNPNPWGHGLNYEGEGKEFVRDYMINASLNWLNNYHCDGIRFDMTKFVDSDNTMKQIAIETKFHAPNSFIVAEDGRFENGDDRLNDPRVIRSLSETSDSKDPQKTKEERIQAHERIVADAIDNKFSLDNLGFDSQWDFAFQHNLLSMILNQEFMGYQPNLKNLEYSLKNGPLNTKYLMSHDEIGNNDGTRLIPKALTAKLGMFYRVEGNNDCEKGQRAADSMQRITEAYLAGNEAIWNPKEQRKLHVTNPISKEEFEHTYKEAKALNRLGTATVVVAPGPKMVFDGDEKGAVSRFKFFAKHPDKNIAQNITNEKGYDIGKTALLDSKLDQDYKNEDPQMEKFTVDMFKILNNSPALSSTNNDSEHLQTYTYGSANTMHVLRKEGDDQILSVMNFSGDDFGEFTLRNLPEGKWEQIITSNDQQYGGSGNLSNDSVVDSGDSQMNIKLPKQSVVMFKKVD